MNEEEQVTNEVREAMCDKLKQAIRNGHLFDVSGGCGIDTAKNTSGCQSGSLWFKFCPFCGRRIAQYHTAHDGW